MRRVSRERWAELFSSCGLMEGDLLNLELLLFPVGGAFPSAPALPAELPFYESGTAGASTSSNTGGQESAEAGGPPREVSRRGGRKEP
eukprot:6213402-Pleurochrysis_carterae.AAC.1